VFSAQYQQNPVAPEGNLIRLEWFGRYEEAPERDYFLKVVQSWDTAMTSDPRSDFSVCTTWGFLDDKWWLLGVFRERLDYPDLKRAVLRLKRLWKADKVVIEDACSGKSLWQEFRADGNLRPLMWPVRDDKETRLIGQTGQLEAGRCLLPMEAPWLAAFCSELKAFPSGRYDDQVDSMTQFLEFEMRNPRWVAQTYTPDGRPIEKLRRPYRSRR
jgi:predicted phage terminase large subunit-like protein